MNFQELTTVLTDNQSSLISVNARQHYQDLLGNIVFMPTTIAQAKKQLSHIKNKSYKDLLMCGQWFGIEQLLNKHGLKGDYTLTKSKTMCRLTNISDYCTALKLEFNL